MERASERLQAAKHDVTVESNIASDGILELERSCQ